MTTEDRKQKLKNEYGAFLAEFARKVYENSAAIFAGAGLSIPSGYVDWRTLLTPIAHDLGLQIEREIDLVRLAQFSVTHRGSRSRITDLIVREFAPLKDSTDNHKILATLPIDTYWTTNYDTLLERTLEAVGRTPDVKRDHRQITYALPGRDVVVYKMHGDIDDPNEIVITKEDYEQYSRNRKPFLDVLMSHLSSKVFLFIGFSFNDPNLDAVLSRLRLLFNDATNTHFAIFKTDTSYLLSDEENMYIAKREQLIKADLLRLGILVMYVQTFEDITILLTLLLEEYTLLLQRVRKSRSVLISGIGNSWGDWSPEEVIDFLSQLTRALIAKQWRIVTSAHYPAELICLSTAVNCLSANNNITTFGDRLLIMPPRSWWNVNDDLSLLNEVSAVIFLFGNNNTGESVTDAEEMRIQFMEAVRLYNDPNRLVMKIPLIPVGATGFMARTLSDEINKEFAKYYPEPHTKSYKLHFDILKAKENGSDSLACAIVSILDLWHRR